MDPLELPLVNRNSQANGADLVCALCPEFIGTPDYKCDIKATESSFMPGTYRRLTDESLGGGRVTGHG